MCCFSLSVMTVNEESLGFGLLFGQKSVKVLLWTLGNYEEHFSFFFIFERLNNELINPGYNL